MQWQPDGLTVHTKKWFLGAGFLGAPPISPQVSVGKSPDLAFLQSLLAWRKRRDVEAALNLLNETLTLHITAFKAAAGYDFFIKLNADFMLEIGGGGEQTDNKQLFTFNKLLTTSNKQPFTFNRP